jgi:hypothetical protein
LELTESGIVAAHLARASMTDLQTVVEVSGIEPLTSCMPCKRSPS